MYESKLIVDASLSYHYYPDTKESSGWGFCFPDRLAQKTLLCERVYTRIKELTVETIISIGLNTYFGMLKLLSYDELYKIDNYLDYYELMTKNELHEDICKFNMNIYLPNGINTNICFKNRNKLGLIVNCYSEKKLIELMTVERAVKM